MHEPRNRQVKCVVLLTPSITAAVHLRSLIIYTVLRSHDILKGFQRLDSFSDGLNFAYTLNSAALAGRNKYNDHLVTQKHLGTPYTATEPNTLLTLPMIELNIVLEVTALKRGILMKSVFQFA